MTTGMQTGPGTAAGGGQREIKPRRRRWGLETGDGPPIRARGLVLRYLLLLLVTAISVGPFIWQFLTSLKGVQDDLYAIPPIWLPKSPTVHNYVRVTEIIPVLQFVLNSLRVAAASVVLNVIGAALAGYALARLKFPGRSAALAVFLGGILVPTEASIIALLQFINDVHLTNTLTGVVLPGCIGGLNVLLMRNAFLSLPRELDEAAAIDGAGVVRRFISVSLPSARGTLVVIGLLSFMTSWDDFLWPLLVLTDTDKYTLTIGLNYLQGTFANDPRVVAAGTIIAVVPLIVLFLVFQRKFFSGIGEGAIKG